MAKQKKGQDVKEEKAVAVKDSNVPSTDLQGYDAADWGAGSAITKKDVIIPRILLMQPMSPPVTDGKAAFGEWRESLNMEKLGDFERGFDVVPFYMEKVFIEYKIENDGKGNVEKKYLRSVPITPANENLKYEGEETNPETGETYALQRDRCMNFYVLLKQELEAGVAFPYVLSFRRSSLRAGQKLVTQMYMKNVNAGLTPASMVIKVLSKKETSDKGGKKVTYGIADVAPVERTDPKLIENAFHWLKMVKQGQAKVHEEAMVDQDTDSEREVSAPSGGTGNF